MKIVKAVLTYNHHEHVEKLVNETAGITVVDASQPGREYQGPGKVVKIDGNGFTLNWNNWLGRTHRGATHFWIASSDVFMPAANWAHIEEVLADETIGVYTPTFDNSSHDFCKNKGQGLRDVPYVEFTAPIISRKCIEAVGLFDEYFTHGWGIDLLYGLAAREKGFRCVVDDYVSLDHLVAYTMQKEGTLNQYHSNAWQQMQVGMELRLGKDWRKKIMAGFKVYANHIF